MSATGFHRLIPASGKSRVIAGLLAMVLIAIPGVILASHQFADVLDSHQFHIPIARLKDAGITGGCSATTYCPDASVTRAQMAGFLNRGLGRGSANYGFIDFADAALTYITDTTVTTGGVAGGTGFVLVNASVTGYTDAAGVCPCDVQVRVDGPTEQSPSMYFDISDTATPTGYRNGSASVTWMFEAPSGTSQNYFLSADLVGSGTLAGTFEGSISAVYVPFGATGGSTLGSGSTESVTSPDDAPRTR